MTNKHFKTDQEAIGGGSYVNYGGSGSHDFKKKEHRREERVAQEVDEEEEIRKAIELSKRTAMEEDKKRIQAITHEIDSQDKKVSVQVQDQEQDFDFSSGFAKFDGQIKGDKPQEHNNLNDFDFGGHSNSHLNKTEEKKEEGILDLLDIPGGGSTQPQLSTGQQDSFDFFNPATSNQKPNESSSNPSNPFDFNIVTPQESRPEDQPKQGGFVPQPFAAPIMAGAG